MLGHTLPQATDDGRTASDRTADRDRGQSAAVGFVLLFSIVLLLLVVLQVTAVPTWNQGEEYDHNERVQDSLEQYRDGLFETAASGRLSSETVELGTRYPTRPFLINPPDPGGNVRTTDPGTISLTGANATGETRDYWNGTRRNFTTRHLTYSPDYNEYGTAPVTVFENSVLYNRFAERSLPVTPERLVRGDDITVVTLNGSLDRTGSSTYDLEAVPLSASETVTTVRSDGGLELTVPTRLPESEWRDLLAEEMDANDGRITSLSTTEGDPYDRLTLTLAAGTYDLRMAKIGVGSRLDRPDAHYVTTETAPELQMTAGGAERLVFTVRDRYNNPVGGVDVNATLSGPGNLTAVQAVTDADGRAVFRYEATDAGQATVTASFGPVANATRTAGVGITVAGGATGGDDDALGVEWVAPSTGSEDRYTFDAGTAAGNTTELTVASEPAIDGLGVSYYVNDTTVGTVAPAGGVAGANGQNTTTFTGRSDGTVAVYAVGGGDSDVLTVTVVNSSTYDLTVQGAQPAGGNDIATTVDVSTADPDATIRVEALRADGSVRDSTTVPVAPTQPQTVETNGQRQITEMRVTLFDGAGTEQARETVPYPSP